MTLLKGRLSHAWYLRITMEELMGFSVHLDREKNLRQSLGRSGAFLGMIGVSAGVPLEPYIMDCSLLAQ